MALMRGYQESLIFAPKSISSFFISETAPRMVPIAFLGVVEEVEKCSSMNGLPVASTPRGCDLTYTPGQFRITRSIIGASDDSITPRTFSHFSVNNLSPALAAIDFESQARKIAFASEGTPGRQKISVEPAFKRTPGAVPIGLGIGVAPAGMSAIFRRALVSLIVCLGNLRV